MTKTLTFAVALGLALGACKKEDKGSEGAKGDTPAKTDKPADTTAKTDTPATDKPATDTPATDKPATDTPAATGDGVAFTWKVPAVGAKKSSTDHMEMDFTITGPDGKDIPMKMSKDVAETVEVLEVNGDVISKVKVTYGDAKETQAMGGKAKTNAMPMSGKTYVVSGDGKTMTVALEDGSPAPEDEAAEVVDDFDDDIGRLPKMVKLITSRTWKVGEAYKLTDADVAAMTTPGSDDPTMTSGTLTLASTDGGVAVFHLDAESVKKDDESEMTMPMKVTAKLDLATMMPGEVSMEGTMSGKANGMPMKGTMKGLKTNKYE